MEQELERMKEKKERLETSGMGLDLISSLLVPGKVPGKPPNGTLAEPGAPKKGSRHKSKRCHGMPPEDGEEYYKSGYIVHL